MSASGRVMSVNVSARKGVAKRPADEIAIDDRGVVGDAHAGPWHRQVSLLGKENIDAFVSATGKQVGPGEFAENVTLEGIDLTDVALLDRFTIGRVELEVAQIGKECHGKGCAIYQEVGQCLMPEQGLFCRVIRGGPVRPGDAVQYLPRIMTVLVVTLSDRAYAGEYADRSGPRAEEILREYFTSRRGKWQVRKALLPDDADRLRQALLAAIEDGVDVVFTLGGTGVGPRDVAPETVAAVCDKIIPGIMEHIRVKFGSEKPSVLLSRSVAGISRGTQIYALPGSVRAVEEYVGEILKTLEHAVLMMQGLDVH